jgi:predicted amidohydrolase YtcJ
MTGISADLVIKIGNIITVDARDTIAEAVAVRDGIIVRVGSNREMEPIIGKKTKIMELSGKTLVPGFIDSHTHNVNASEFGGNSRQLNMASELNPSIADLQQRIRERVKETSKGDWIGGRYLDPNGLKERRWPTREELDAVAPENPVIIKMRGVSANIVVNTRTLELAGITGDTPSPEGGFIEKDPLTGEPTGILRKVPFMKTVVPQATLEDLKDGLAAISQEYVKTGVTSTGDAGCHNDRPEAYRAYQEAIAEGRLKTRTYLMIHEEFYRKNDLGLRTGFGNDRLRLGAVKYVLDGSIQALTCAFNEPYVNKNTRGLEGLRYTQERLNEVIAESHRLGYQVAFHAQGDYAITIAVNAIEYAMQKYPRPDPRHRIEHTLCPRVEDLKRMKKLGIIANFYLFHPWFWGDQHINNFIGKERANKMVPVKTAMKMGIVSCAHSDCPVCTPNDPVWPANPLWGMWCAVNRKTRSGVDIGPQEKLTPMEALRAYTINGAYASFEEDIKGSIEPGKLADMVVLSDNPLEVDLWEIRNITVEKTIVGGKIVYENK